MAFVDPIAYAWVALHRGRPFPPQLGEISATAVGTSLVETDARQAVRNRFASNGKGRHAAVTEDVLAKRRRHYAERRVRLGLPPPKNMQAAGVATGTNRDAA